MSDTTTANTNGSATPVQVAKPSPLIAIRAEFDKAGGKVDGKAAKAAGAKLAEASAAVAAAEKALEEAREKVYAASRTLMVLTGAQPVTIGGVEYQPSARGERVFYRPMGRRETITL